MKYIFLYMLSTVLAMPEDTEELALTLNGKKRKLSRQDFLIAFKASGLNEKVIENLFLKFQKLIPQWLEFINYSFLAVEMKRAYQFLNKQKNDLIQL